MIFLHHLGNLLRDQPKLSLESILQSNILQSEKKKSSESDQQDLSSYLVELAQRLAEYSYTQAAIILYKLSLKIHPENQVVSQKIELALITQETINLQIQQAQAIVQLHPQSFQAYRDLGAILLLNNYWNESIKAYLKALELKPEISAWYYDIGFWDLAQHQNQLNRVIEIYRRVIQKTPHCITSHVNLGKALSLQGKATEAIACYREAGRQQTLAKYTKLQTRSNLKLIPVESPDFIIIGAQKCGTTSLYHYLAQHPKILPSTFKELHFWSKNFDQGLEWYLAQFPPLPDRQEIITGEASPNYLENTNAPSRLREVFPQMKLIVLLRNPVDRAVSHYHHWVRIHREQQSLEKTIAVELEWLNPGSNSLNIDPRYWTQTPKYIWRGLYIKFLQQWMTIFPREQFLILRSEDFYTQPESTLTQVFDFLNLPPASDIDLKPYNQGFYQPMPEILRQQLQTFFAPYNHKLEAFLEMNFHWNFD